MENPTVIAALGKGGRTLHITVEPYDRAAVGKIKTLAGRKWNPGARRWEVPLAEGEKKDRAVRHPHPASHVRHAFNGPGDGHPAYSGSAGAFQYKDDADLYARECEEHRKYKKPDSGHVIWK